MYRVLQKLPYEHYHHHYYEVRTTYPAGPIDITLFTGPSILPSLPVPGVPSLFLSLPSTFHFSFLPTFSLFSQ